MKATRILLLVLLLLLTGSVLGGAWAWRELTTPVVPPGGRTLVSISSGETFRSTCERLRGAGLVRHPLLLRFWARWTGSDRLIRSGDYRFDKPVSPLELLAALRSPGVVEHRVTIPEGKTLREIALLLENAGLGGADQFLCAAEDPSFLLSIHVPGTGLEGYLFPDTYTFPLRTPPQLVLQTMVDRFRDMVAGLEDVRQQTKLSEQEMVILASIIEKETGSTSERSLVSAVFHNRLRIGMRLQSDPTAVYGREGTGPVTARDLEIDSPYNTYLHAGLPPGPICNPGLAALEAAIQPASVPYLYFVAAADGSHTFSRTLREHNRAVAALRRRSAP